MTKRLGLALGAGAARGWAHIGVLRGLKELGLEPDIIAGCSVGALVGGAHLIGALDEFEAWAHSLSPLAALRSFNFQITKGGFVNAANAFEAFEEFDRDIETLNVKYGAVACDLATGDEIEITTGSILTAARASSAIPVLLQAIPHQGRWLVDGAIVNPTPISLARKLGADVVIAVDLMAVPKALHRFDETGPRFGEDIDDKSMLDLKNHRDDKHPREKISAAVTKLITDTRQGVEREIQKARDKMKAKPQLFETAMAVTDILQMNIARARAQSMPADILLAPDMREALPTSFDRADEFIETGRQALLNQRYEIERLLRS